MLSPRERARRRVWEPSERRLEILATVSELFACERLGPEAALQQAVAVLSDLLGDAIVVHRLGGSGQWLEPLAWHDRSRDAQRALDRLGGHRFCPDRGFTAGVLDTGQAVLVPRVTPLEIELLQPEFAPVAEAMGLRGFVLAPMKVGGRLTGLLAQCRLRPEPPLDADDCCFLEEVALRLGLSVACPAAVDDGG